MANKDYRNYGTIEPQYYQENLGPLTVKGKKSALVAGLQSRLDENQAKLQELKKYEESLAKNGKTLDAEDTARMKRIERIISDLKRIIDEQIQSFNLKVK